MKMFVGKVIGTKAAKTAVVAVERIVVHPLYGKRFKRIKNYQVHDEIGVKEGERVRFAACKPYSKLKKWKVINIINNKKGVKRITKEAKN
jgi:small subunit ribosomal protein S17